MDVKFKEEIWYLAHPYTCKDSDGKYIWQGEEANFHLCCIRTAKLIEAGFVVYSPIAHTHPVHAAWPNFCGGEIHEMWYEFDNVFINLIPFKGIILAPQWETSSGCRSEKDLFERMHKPIWFYRDIIGKADSEEV